MSASSKIFQRLMKKHSAAHVARKLGCDESAVRNWAAGRRTPNETWRGKLVAFDARLCPEGWEEPSAEQDTMKRPARREPVTPTAPSVAAVRAIDGEGQLVSVIAECDRLLAAADSDEATSMRDRTTLLSTKASAAIRLSRIRNEDAISMRKFVATKTWAAIEEAFGDVLKAVPKEMAAEFARRLRELEAEGGAS
jgi:hypothetical protein